MEWNSNRFMSKVSSSEKPVYQGRIYKYTNGYKHDFVPRMMVITNDSVEIYKNMLQVYGNGISEEPLVKIMAEEVSEASRFTFNSAMAVQKKLPRNLFKDIINESDLLPKPDDLYKLMIEVRIDEDPVPRLRSADRCTYDPFKMTLDSIMHQKSPHTMGVRKQKWLNTDGRLLFSCANKAQ